MKLSQVWRRPGRAPQNQWEKFTAAFWNVIVCCAILLLIHFSGPSKPPFGF